jgi:hypothetical protein
MLENKLTVLKEYINKLKKGIYTRIYLKCKSTSTICLKERQKTLVSYRLQRT